MMTLNELGWSAEWNHRFASFASGGYMPVRISAEHRGLYEYLSTEGPGTAVITGRLRHEAYSRASFPVTGDWVALERTAASGPSVIHAIVPRQNLFSRKAAGSAIDEQPIAANIDTLFLVTSLNRDLNPKRLERYLAAASGLDAELVLLLTKSDLIADPEPVLRDLRARIPHVAIHAVSASAGIGLEQLDRYLHIGKTVALVGSSGVGKSTLINRLLSTRAPDSARTASDESYLATAPIREDDDRGRHTTTTRELVPLPGGGLIIDNPGMRELQLWKEEEEVVAAFADIECLAKDCYYTDCQHESEPRCAVKAAIEAGNLDAGRLENFRKLGREARFLETKGSYEAQRSRKQHWKAIHREQKRQYRRREQERFG